MLFMLSEGLGLARPMLAPLPDSSIFWMLDLTDIAKAKLAED